MNKLKDIVNKCNCDYCKYRTLNQLKFNTFFKYIVITDNNICNYSKEFL